MKKLLTLVLAGLILTALSGCVRENDMTHISTLEQLQAMKDDLTADYVLDNDIDASATSGWNGGAGFEPIGGEEPYFTGSFDGQGHKISNLYINREATPDMPYVGLFGFAYLDTEIKNLGLENVDITGRSGPPPYKCRVGALVGRNWAKITNCYSTGNVASVEGLDTGGLVGLHSRQSLACCYSTADVIATGTGNYGYCHVGGLTGNCTGGDTQKCYATGSVEASGGKYNYAGGFTGYVLAASLNDCYAQGSVHAIKGGGSVARAGGFTPTNSSGGNITNCYSTGAVSKTGSGLIGGFCAKNYATITACFWDTETSGQATSAGGTGKTTAEMQTKSTFTDAGWDFDAIWDISISYPWLRSGICEEEEPQPIIALIG